MINGVANICNYVDNCAYKRDVQVSTTEVVFCGSKHDCQYAIENTVLVVPVGESNNR